MRGNRTVTSDTPEETYDVLKKYGRDLTEAARAQKLDPVIGRDEEIRNVIRILSRKSKNNPCLIGEPGVGKTAIAEGLALRIVAGDEVPELGREALYTLCALRRPLTRRRVGRRLTAMSPAERKALMRYMAAEGYSPGLLRRLFDARERSYCESLVQSYKRSLA